MTAPMTSREAPEEIEHWIELLAEGRANLSAYEMRDISVTLRLLSERCEELRDAQLFVAEQELKRAGAAQAAPTRDAIAAQIKRNGFTSRDGTVINGGTFGVIDLILSLMSSTHSNTVAEPSRCKNPVTRGESKETDASTGDVPVASVSSPSVTSNQGKTP